MWQSSSPPPITFAVRNVKKMVPFPDGQDVLWAADVKAVRRSEFVRVFDEILFVESSGMAFVYGMEFADGLVPELRQDLALRQQEFVLFLRAQTTCDNDSIGLARHLFQGAEYACEGKCMAAYIAMRNEPLRMGVGYQSVDGYQMLSLDPEEGGWMDRARGTVSFGEMGVL